MRIATRIKNLVQRPREGAPAQELGRSRLLFEEFGERAGDVLEDFAVLLGRQARRDTHVGNEKLVVLGAHREARELGAASEEGLHLLHEWVAEEKGYFKAEGLDYEFREAFKGQDLARAHATANKVGAYQNIEAGRDSNVSCACHWTVNVAASKGHAKMYADAYSVSPSAVFVPPESPIKTPEDLRGVPISVGHQSG